MAIGTKLHTPLPPLEVVKEKFSYDGVDLFWRVGKRRGKRAGGSHDRGYRNVFIAGFGRFYTHRLIWLWWYGEDPGDYQIDHRNRDTSDNRISNLRRTDACGQQQNRIMKAGKQSQYRGVRVSYLADGTPRWLAAIRPANMPPKHLGTFDTELEAAAAYNDAAVLHHGVFAVLNDIPVA